MRQLAAALALAPVVSRPSARRPGRPARGRTRLVGRAVRVRTAVIPSRLHGDEQLLHFRLVGEEAFRVELRGAAVDGALREGDFVEVPVRGPRTDGDRLDVRRVLNLSTGLAVVAQRRPRLLRAG